MNSYLVIAILALAALISAGLGLLNFSVTAYQQLIVLLMILSFVVFGWFTPKRNLSIFSYGTLLISSLLVQLLINSSGGFYSPFLILFHFYILGLGFLVSMKAAVSFVVFGVALLGFELMTVPTQKQLFASDPGTAILYITSFIVIVPFAQFIASRYRVKDELSQLLTRQVKVGESILQSLNELVVVTDLKLNIISVNESMKKVLKKGDSDLKGKQMLAVISLKDLNGQPMDEQALSVNRVIEDRATRIVNDLMLYTPSRPTPFRVSVQVRPVLEANGKLDQLTFVINEGLMAKKANDEDADLAKVWQKQARNFDNLDKDADMASLPKLSFEARIIQKTEEDIEIYRRLETTPIHPENQLVDVAGVGYDVVQHKAKMADSFGMNLKLKLPDDATGNELNLLEMGRQQGGQTFGPELSAFSVSVDSKWVRVLLDKMVDLAILLTSVEKPLIEVVIWHQPEGIRMAVCFNGPVGLATPDRWLFAKYYNGIEGMAHLDIGSGLEGYIAHVVALHLNLPLSVEINPQNGLWTISVLLGRGAQSATVVAPTA